MTLAKAAPTTIINNLGPITQNSVTALSSCTAFDTETAIQVTLEVVCTFGASALGAELYVFGSVDGTNYSSKPIGTYPVILEASATARQLFSVPHGPRYLKCTFKNLGAVDITAVYVNAQAQTVS